LNLSFGEIHCPAEISGYRRWLYREAITAEVDDL
jgi:hypothetical protein